MVSEISAQRCLCIEAELDIPDFGTIVADNNTHQPGKLRSPFFQKCKVS
jgi:hypothetical protein